MQSTNTYTQRLPRIAERIITPCGVSGAVSNEELAKGVPHPHGVVCNALWDTGSSRSGISARLAQRLGLVRLGLSKSHSANGYVESDVYSVNLFLPDRRTELSEVPVSCITLDDEVDILLGMDIITMCDFSITNQGEKTTFSYQIPSTMTIDFERGDV